MAGGNDSRNRSSKIPKRIRRASGPPKPRKFPEAGPLERTVTIVGHPVNIWWIDRLNSPEQEELLGLWVAEYDEIYLSRELSEHVFKEVLLHELLHAISDLSLGNGDRLTEKQVQVLANVLLDTISRNEFAYLFES